MKKFIKNTRFEKVYCEHYVQATFKNNDREYQKKNEIQFAYRKNGEELF